MWIIGIQNKGQGVFLAMQIIGMYDILVYIKHDSVCVCTRTNFVASCEDFGTNFRSVADAICENVKGPQFFRY